MDKTNNNRMSEPFEMVFDIRSAWKLVQSSRPRYPLRRLGFEAGCGHEGFVVDKVALAQVSSEYLGFLCQSSFDQLLHNHHHLSSGAGTIGQ
jgi:hypothetical protein